MDTKVKLSFEEFSEIIAKVVRELGRLEESKEAVQATRFVPYNETYKGFLRFIQVQYDDLDESHPDFELDKIIMEESNYLTKIISPPYRYDDKWEVTLLYGEILKLDDPVLRIQYDIVASLVIRTLMKIGKYARFSTVSAKRVAEYILIYSFAEAMHLKYPICYIQWRNIDKWVRENYVNYITNYDIPKSAVREAERYIRTHYTTGEEEDK